MADMALLLLVFFMASTSTEPPKGVEVELPVAKTRGAEQESLYVTISKQGELFLDGKATSLEGLGVSLAFRQSEKSHIVSITADKSIKYDLISQVLGVLRKEDFLNIVFVSESIDEVRWRQ